MAGETLEKWELTVLIAEDEENILQVFSAILNRRFSRVISAANGVEAYAFYEQYRPDIVITDIQMPIMNGLALSKKIREQDADTPIIIITAHNDSKYLLDSESYGVNAYITKPVKKDEMVAIISKTVEGVIRRKK